MRRKQNSRVSKSKLIRLSRASPRATEQLHSFAELQPSIDKWFDLL